jgi:hypothetical protein
VSRRESSGAENRAPAELMWNLGVDRVRGGEMHHAREYTSADLDHLTHFLGHTLGLDYGLVRRRLAAMLPEAPARAKGGCKDCRQRVSIRGHPRCVRCFYQHVLCYHCGMPGARGRSSARSGGGNRPRTCAGRFIAAAFASRCRARGVASQQRCRGRAGVARQRRSGAGLVGG